MKIRVAVVDDEVELVSELQRILLAAGIFEDVVVFHSGEDFIHHFGNQIFDVVLMDIGLPQLSGIQVIQKLKPLRPETQYVAFTIFDDDSNVFDALRAGATGYVLKSSPASEILNAILEVEAGASPMSSSISRRVINHFARTHVEADELPLTPRETEILELLAEGLRYKEIADQLFISLDTVRTHIRNIYLKLEVSNKTEAINRFRK